MLPSDFEYIVKPTTSGGKDSKSQPLDPALLLPHFSRPHQLWFSTHHRTFTCNPSSKLCRGLQLLSAVILAASIT